MKELGIVRKIDKLGRIVIPMEFRKYLNITNSTELSITIVNGDIVIKKLQNKCILCSKFIERKKSVGKYKFLNRLCDQCIKDITNYSDSVNH